MPRRIEPSKRRFARRLRSDTTDAERRLWTFLRQRQLEGMGFNRQVVIGRHVADFCCREARLVIEVDGGQHDEGRQKDYERTAQLEAAGYRVIRFWNNDVLTNIDGVAHKIREALASQIDDA